jgi:hypothetical protein
MKNAKDPFYRVKIIEKCYGKIITEINYPDASIRGIFRLKVL